MAHFKLMPDVVDLREVTFTNILLLGFDVEQNEAQYRIPFTRDMFSVPNRKGMEVVLHFLFLKLNPDSAKESFRNCWPLIDKKKEQEFRKICTEWLTKIKKDDTESRLPTIVPSLLISPGGDKFYQFLFYFSIYVLKQKISHFPGKYGVLPSWPSISTANKKYLPQLVRSLTVSAINKKARLIAFMESLTPTKNEWVKFAREQSKEHRKLSKLRRECEREIKELKVIQEQIFGKGTISSKETLKRTQNLQKTTEFWKTLSKLFEAEKCLQEKIDEIVNTSKEKKSLDGHTINFKVPDILLRECEKQLHAGKRYQNLYEAGKVNLLSLVQLWNLSLHLVKEALSQFPLPNMEQDEAYIRAEAHNHTNNLNSFMTLRNSLSKRLLPDLRLSAGELKDSIKEKSDTIQFKHFSKKLGLDFLPATPPVYFEAATSDNSTTNNNIVVNQHQYVDTPDAVDVLLHRIRKDAKKISGEHQDDTPVRAVPRSKMAASTSKKNTKAFFKEKVPMSEQPKTAARSHASKIPLYSSKASKLHLATKNNPTQLSFKTPVRNMEIAENKTAESIAKKYRAQQTPLHMHTRTPTPEKRACQQTPAPEERACQRTPPPNERLQMTTPAAKSGEATSKFGTTKAQQLLIDQIAQSVLSQTALSDCTGSDTEDAVEVKEDSGRMHALDDPIEAFSADAFQSRDKVPRTPGTKAKRDRFCEENNNEGRRFVPSLSQMPVKEVVETTPPQHFNESRLNEVSNAHAQTGPAHDVRIGVSPSSSLSSSFDLKALQERIDEIKSRAGKETQTSASIAKDQQHVEEDEQNSQNQNGSFTPSPPTGFNSTTTPANNAYNAAENRMFISPLHDIRTPISHNPLSTNYNINSNPITPLHELDPDMTPVALSIASVSSNDLGAVDFTPIKTPWKTEYNHTTKDFPSPSKRIEACENIERNPDMSCHHDPTKNMLLFTPIQSNTMGKLPAADSNNSQKVKPNISSHYDATKDMTLFTPVPSNTTTTASGRMPMDSNDTATSGSAATGTTIDKTDVDLFLQNNKYIFTPEILRNSSSKTPNWMTNQTTNNMQQQQQTPSSWMMDATTNHKQQQQQISTASTISPFTPSMNLMTFITPFKDPNSPMPNDTMTPVNLNISAEEVDDFIDEVISNTSKNTPSTFSSAIKNVMKTPGLFGVKEPAGINNDYSLMTPSFGQSGPFRLDFSDGDDDGFL